MGKDTNNRYPPQPFANSARKLYFYDAFLRVGVTKYKFLHQSANFGNSSADPADPPDPAKAVPRDAVGTLPSTRRSLRMT